MQPMPSNYLLILLFCTHLVDVRCFYVLECEASVLPHPEKVAKGGEDAFFISPHAIGVADGVGGWAFQGVDPSAYSRALCRGAAQKLIDQHHHQQGLKESNNDKDDYKDDKDDDDINDFIQSRAMEKDGVQALRLMVAGYRYATKLRVPGSATFNIATINPITGVLAVANLGDSSIMVARSAAAAAAADYHLLYRSEEQQKQFNFPYQLGLESEDTPFDANISTIQLKVGDVLVQGSDGLFDNIYQHTLLELLNRYALDERQQQELFQSSTQEELEAVGEEHRRSAQPHPFASPASSPALHRILHSPNSLSQEISLLARRNGADTKFLSPFAKAAKAARFPYLTGGKLDDVTAVVCYVARRHRPTPVTNVKAAIASATNSNGLAQFSSSNAIDDVSLYAPTSATTSSSFSSLSPLFIFIILASLFFIKKILK